MSAYVPGEQPSDSSVSVIKLNTNENPYPPSPRVAEALSGFSAESLRLYPDPESRKLRRAIADMHGCALEQVFVGNGSDEILALATRVFVEDEGSIGFFVPSYSLYPVLAEIRGVAARPVELGADFEWRMPDDYSASLFFITNPNAPTGMRYPRQEIVSFCRRFKRVVVIDEAYAFFADEHCADLATTMDNVLAVRTLSKSHSLAGLRVGYAIGSSCLVNALFKAKDSYNLGRIEQCLALAAVLDGETVAKNAERIKATRRRCAELLAELGFEVYPSQTNFLWVRPPRLNAGTLYRELRKHNILVRHFPGPRTCSFLRITIGTDKEVDALVAATAEILACHHTS